MKKLLILNGPNLNMLGKREPEIYGSFTYDDLKEYIINYNFDVELSFFQSNFEGEIIDKIQEMDFDGLVINPGAYSHYSIAILDALLIIDKPIVEVHISDISNREHFRKNSITSFAADKMIKGKGKYGYIKAIKYIIEKKDFK